MIVVKKLDELKKVISTLRNEKPSKSIGFVPTMGALHEGHVSLVQKAAQTTDYVVCSIFINPTQFNDSNDLKRYPRTPEFDIKLLSENSCDLLFLPSEKEVYPDKIKNYKIDFQGLDTPMEGKYRPGHFKGVAMVVERLFEMVNPDVAFFGQKDFQQLVIIRHMVELRRLNLQIIACPTKRSEKGLALSSRNSRLSQDEKEDALIISRTLEFGRSIIREGMLTTQLEKRMKDFFYTGKLQLEYLEIVDNYNLKTPKEITQNCTCCIAAYCGDVRLIDNINLG